LTKIERIAADNLKNVSVGEYAMKALKHAGTNEQPEKRPVAVRQVRECFLYTKQGGETAGAFVYKTGAPFSEKTAVRSIVPQKFYSQIVFSLCLPFRG
jgi:ABC-type molybdate transport system substrate-binding protein